MKTKKLVFLISFLLLILILYVIQFDFRNKQYSLSAKDYSLTESAFSNNTPGFLKHNLLNAKPVVSNIQTTNMPSIHAVKITYDLSDAESDPMRVTLRISNDSGKTYLFPCDSVTGDIGYPVSPGNQKQIFWYYSTTPAVLKAKIIADDLIPINISEIVNQIDSNRILENLRFIEGIRHRTAGVVQLQRVKDSIYNRFVRYGLQTSIHNFNYSGYNAQNFLGRLPGTIFEDTTYIVDGHYETVNNSPGADDNGSAVAGFLEIARVLSNNNFRNTVKFIGFDLEELSYVGSQRYVAEGIPSYEKISGVYNFEMIGYYCDAPNCQSLPTGFCTLFPALCDSLTAQQSKGNFILNAANVNSNSIRYHFDSCARVYVPQLRVLSLATPGNGQTTAFLRRSDHAPFWDAGYKALMLTDGAEYRNNRYHTPGDTVGTLNIKFITNVVKATTAAVANIAGIQHSGFGTSNLFSVGINNISELIPDKFALYQNYPNPFNPRTVIRFEAPVSGNVSLKVYNINGKEIAEIINEKLNAGTYETDFDGTGLTSGVYFYQMKAGNFTDTRRMILIK